MRCQVLRTPGKPNRLWRTTVTPHTQSTSVPYGIVYWLRNRVNGKVYIGQTVSKDQRWRSHKHNGIHGDSPCAIHKAMKKYGHEAFTMEVLCKCPNRESLDEAERFLIWILGSAKRSFGYNLTTGGRGCRGTIAVRQKMSKAIKGRVSPMKGKHHTEETKRKIAEAHTGRKASPEIREKLSRVHKGMPIAEETKEKLRAALIGRKRGPQPEWWKEKLSAGARRRMATDEGKNHLNSLWEGRKSRSGVRGVWFDESSGSKKPWRAVSRVGGKRIDCGRFATLDEARLAIDNKLNAGRAVRG